MARKIDSAVFILPLVGMIFGLFIGSYFYPDYQAAAAPTYVGVVVDQPGEDSYYPGGSGTPLCNAAAFEKKGMSPGTEFCVCQHEKGAIEQGFRSWMIIDSTGALGNGIVSTHSQPMFQSGSTSLACERLV